MSWCKRAIRPAIRPEIIRIEQLYPFPGDPAGQAPEGDAGAGRAGLGAGRAEEQWRHRHFVEDELEECLIELASRGEARPLCRPRRLRFAGHRAGQRHAAEQAALIAERWGIAAAALGNPHKLRKETRLMATGVKVPALGESITEGTLPHG